MTTVRTLLEQDPSEVLVVDQTPQHEPETQWALEEWALGRRIRWIRLLRPSITRAMNTALTMASHPLVLFLDDDSEPSGSLLAAHASSYEDAAVWAVVGQVLQPGQEPTAVGQSGDSVGFDADLSFPFNSQHKAWVRSAIACNFSVRRQRALEVGGFDENFVGVAYRFETEFVRRLTRAGGRVLFEPGAPVRHLKVPAGGTRAYGSHLTSMSPRHGVGDYYFAIREGLSPSTLGYVLRRPLREICTRFHLRHPWWIPVKMIGEVGALLWAFLLSLRGPRYLTPASTS